VIKENNDALADEWAGQMPNLSSERSSRQVESIRGSLDALAQARSAAALEQARAAAREGLATGAGSIAGVLGLLSAAAPPAALVLAPAAAVLGALAALAGLLLQVIPREWLATAESVPPRLPLPYMVTGDEGAASAPTHSADSTTSFARSTHAARTAPEPLDSPPLTAVLTLDAPAVPSRTSTMVRSPQLPQTSVVNLLRESPARAPTVGGDDPRGDAVPQVLQLIPDGGSQSPVGYPTPSRTNSSSSTAVVLASIGVGAALWWLSSRR
jgi:hypothetical protein